MPTTYSALVWAPKTASNNTGPELNLLEHTYVSQAATYLLGLGTEECIKDEQLLEDLQGLIGCTHRSLRTILPEALQIPSSSVEERGRPGK